MNGFSTLKVPLAGFLSIKWCPNVIPFKAAAGPLSNPFDPLYARMKSENASLPTDSLRWKIVTNMSKKALSKEVLRRRLKRRWQEAFLKALRTRGLDRNGRSLPSDSVKMRKEGIVGTLEVHVYDGKGFESPFHHLVQQATAVLRAIPVRAQGQEAWARASSQSHRTLPLEQGTPALGF